MDAANLVRLAQCAVNDAKAFHEDSLEVLKECLTVQRDFERQRILLKPSSAFCSQLESYQATSRLINRDRQDALDWVWRSANSLELAHNKLRRAEERQRNEETAASKAREAATPPTPKCRCRTRRLTAVREAHLAYISPVWVEFPDGSKVLAPSPREERAMRKARRESRLRARRPRRKSKDKAPLAVASRVSSDTQAATREVQRVVDQRDGARRNGSHQSEQCMAALFARASRKAALVATTECPAPTSSVSG